MVRTSFAAILSVLLCFSNSAAAQLISPFGGAPAAALDSTSHSARSLAALRLADEAAKAGLLDVSFEAVRRAIGGGPPVEAIKLGSILGGPTPRTSSMRQTQQDFSHENNLAQRLAELDAAWIEADADPQEAYVLCRDCVFPPARPGEAFAYGIVSTSTGGSYSLSLTPSKPEPMDQCLCRSLIVWAKKADRIDELRTLLDDRADRPAARPVVDLARMLLAIEDDSVDSEKVCSVIAENAGQLVTGRSAHQISYFVSQFIEKLPADSPARRRLVESACSAALSNQQTWLGNQWLRYLIAKETETSIKAGDWERFNMLFSLMESVLNPIRSGNEDYVQRTISRAYATAANTAFASSHIEFGLRCLKLQIANSAGAPSTNSIPSTLLDVNENTFRKLLGMSQADRYQSLGDIVWTMPMLGLNSLVTFAPREELPKRFVENYKAYRKTDRLPIEQACVLGSQSLSMLEWVMRDAIALGKEDEIQAKIKKLHADGSDDALLADLVWAKAHGKPLDVSKLLVADSDGKKSLRPEITGERGPVSAFDLDIVAAAIGSKETYTAGLDLAKRIADRTYVNRSNTVAHGRRILAEAEFLGDSPPTTSSVLKHFVTAADFRARAVHSGLPARSYWLKNDDGNWEHRVSAARSMLLLKYPLSGDFKITFDCNDNTYAESATTAFGLNIDFRGYVSDVAVEYVGERGKLTAAAESMKRGEKNSIELEHNAADGTLSLTLNEKPVDVFKTSEATFPFVGPQSMMHRQMTLENFKITGSPTIPRSVDLLSPSLIGWSNLFHSRALPKPAVAREDAEEAESANSDASAKTEGSKSAVVGYDWENVDGVLQTVDHAALFAADQKAGIKSKKRYQRPGEEWIYYVRPLCDGETVEFEFYQESGSYSLQPTMDRIALQMGEQLREHWIVSDPNLFGIASSNRRDVPSDQVLGQVKLLEKQWNKASMRRTSDTLTLAINGSDIYQQKVDPIYGGRFGFMGNPSQFQVKVRSVALRGDWPETLPSNLFEEK